jgi:hypothetical protein
MAHGSGASNSTRLDQFLGRLLLALSIDDLGAASRDRKARLIRLGESGWRRTVPKVPGRFVDDLPQNCHDHPEPIIVRSGLLLGKADSSWLLLDRRVIELTASHAAAAIVGCRPA